MSETPDLIAATLSGDTDAFGALVERHQGAVRRMLIAHGLDEALIEELVQATFVSAYENLTQLRDPEALVAWLKSIARNHLRRERNRQRRLSALQGAVLTERECDRGLDQLDEGVDEQLLERLYRCLDQLGARARQLLDQHYQQALAADAIARLHDRDANWVRVTLHRIRARLRRCLGAAEVEGRA